MDKLRSSQEIVLRFAYVLALRNYQDAYAITSQAYQQKISIAQMQKQFEQIIPDDWGPIDPIIVADEMLDDWPDKQASDIGWIYVSLEGTVYPYSEGLYILVALEDDMPTINDINFGRP
jgi:hypothetical protein